MLICSNCFEKRAIYFDGSTKYNWCYDCVSKGCSCNDISICKKDSDDLKGYLSGDHEHNDEIFVEKDSQVWSFKNQIHLNIDLIQGDSYKAYPILKNNKLDYSNPIFLPIEGINYNDSIIDFYMDERYCEKEFNFLQKYIFDIDSSLLELMIEGHINGYDDIDTNIYKKEEIEKSLNYSKIKGKYFYKLIRQFHVINNDVMYSSVFDESIHAGCDCGCGGDMIDDNDIKYIEKRCKVRKRIFKEILNYIHREN